MKGTMVGVASGRREYEDVGRVLSQCTAVERAAVGGRGVWSRVKIRPAYGIAGLNGELRG